MSEKSTYVEPLFYNPHHRLNLNETLHILSLDDLDFSVQWLPLADADTHEVRAMDSRNIWEKRLWHVNEECHLLFVIHGGNCFRMDDRVAKKFHYTKDDRKDHIKLVDITQTHPELGDGDWSFLWKYSLMTLTSERAGYFYLIKSGMFYKVGITTNLDKRYKRYVTESPHENKLIMAFHCLGYDRFEMAIKELFKNKLHRGEWFKLEPEDVEMIYMIASVGQYGPRESHIENFYPAPYALKDPTLTKGKFLCW